MYQWFRFDSTPWAGLLNPCLGFRLPELSCSCPFAAEAITALREQVGGFRERTGAVSSPNDGFSFREDLTSFAPKLVLQARMEGLRCGLPCFSFPSKALPSLGKGKYFLEKGLSGCPKMTLEAGSAF